MLDTKHTPFDTVSDRRTVRTPLRTHPSLLSLRMALVAAEKESPARPPRPITADEKRAMMLIEKMKTEYDKPLSFANFVQRTPKRRCGAVATSLTLDTTNTKSGDFVLRIQHAIVKANA